MKSKTRVVAIRITYKTSKTSKSLIGRHTWHFNVTDDVERELSLIVQVLSLLKCESLNPKLAN
jgi:hypothetical protein